MQLKQQIIEQLKTIMDPEVPVNIYELGLIYNVDVDDFGIARIEMTLTTPNCPVAESLPKEVANKVKAIDGIEDADVDIVWDPPWTKDMMTDAAKLALNML